MANFDKGCMIEGFVYSYGFLLAFAPFLFLKQRKAWLVYLGGVLPFVLLFLVIGETYSIFLYFGFLIVGYITGLGIYKIKAKNQNSKVKESNDF